MIILPCRLAYLPFLSTGPDRNTKSKYVLNYDSSWFSFFVFICMRVAYRIFCFVRPESVHLSMRFTKLKMAYDCSHFHVGLARVHREIKGN